MRRGPAPKPNRLKILAGNPGRRPLNDDEPQPKLVTRLAAPVKLDSHGLKFWRYYATLLKRVRVLSEADIHALAAAAQWWSVYQRAMEGLKDGLTQITEANGEVAKPSVGIAKQAFSQCWAKNEGQERQRINIPTRHRLVGQVLPQRKGLPGIERIR